MSDNLKASRSGAAHAGSDSDARDFRVIGADSERCLHQPESRATPTNSEEIPRQRAPQAHAVYNAHSADPVVYMTHMTSASR